MSASTGKACQPCAATSLSLPERCPLLACLPVPQTQTPSIWAWGSWPPMASKVPAPPHALPSLLHHLRLALPCITFPMFCNSWLSLIKPHSAGFHLVRN